MRTTPKDVKEKRKTIEAAAASDGASSGNVTSCSRRHGPAPRTAAASAARGSSAAQYVPTTRTTTATLKKACARRIAAGPCSSPSGSTARNASATTAVGRTKGTVTSARARVRPGKSKRPSTYAAGRPTASVSAVDATASQTVNQSTSRVSGSVRTSSVDLPPVVVSPRSTIAPSGKTKKSARNASGIPYASKRNARPAGSDPRGLTPDHVGPARTGADPTGLTPAYRP